MRDHLVSNGLATTEELDRIEAAHRELIEEAVAFAEKGPLPEPGELTTDVYVIAQNGGAR